MSRPRAPKPTADASPVRTCVGCGRRSSTEELIRFVSDGRGGLLAGRSAPGRGAWLCATTATGATPCAVLALRKNAFSRALRETVDRGRVAATLRDLGFEVGIDR